MEKKKILFVMEHLGIGGAEKSLVTLLSCLDYSKYDVDLFLFRKTGVLLSFVPDEVNILLEIPEYRNLSQSPIKSLVYFFMQKKIKLFFFNLLYLIRLSFCHFILQREYIGWKYIRNFFGTFDKHYDIAIGFLEKKTIYFTVDKINADKKIGYIHNDYLKIQHNKSLDNHYFAYLDNVVTVSEHCLKVLQQTFATQYSKFIMIRNIISPSIINAMANEKVAEINRKYITIVTVARLVEQKGIDNAIIICEKLLEEVENIKWYVIGEGSEREKIEKLITKKGLENIFFLIGAQSNPYKYMRIADIYVQPSRFEGYGITIAEAKALCKPIVASNIPEFQEQLIDLETGLLCDSNDSMAIAILNLITNKKLRKILANNLKSIDALDSKTELEKFYKICGECPNE